MGLAKFSKLYPECAEARIFVPVTNHYSWPKSATVLGLGQDSVIGIPVDENCRMNTIKLSDELSVCAREGYPVIMVVAVIGSTEEGVVDNLEGILKTRETARNHGVRFHLHCDAAWGGYLKSMLIEPQASDENVVRAHLVPVLPMSSYAQKNYRLIAEADTVTVDPHKAGFIPYPAGSLCYRNGKLRYLITFNADYIHSDLNNNMGIFGLEGSKPGAAAAAVWMAHKSIPLNKAGYGQILAECMFSTKLYYCYWLTLANPGDPFDIQFLVDLPPAISDPLTGEPLITGRDNILNFIRNNIIGKSNEDIANNNKAMFVLQQIGSDVLINTFAVNYKINGRFNQDITSLNNLNQLLFDKFSITTPKQALKGDTDYMLTMSTLAYENYEKSFGKITKVWGLHTSAKFSLKFLIILFCNLGQTRRDLSPRL
jgi:vitellogenic carboxypeptidase-like protein